MRRRAKDWEGMKGKGGREREREREERLVSSVLLVTYYVCHGSGNLGRQSGSD